MDEQRAQVFNNEDGAPLYLWTEIFDVDIATVPKTSAFDGDILVIGDQRSITPFGDAQTVYRAVG
jgi:hypothetical protein